VSSQRGVVKITKKYGEEKDSISIINKIPLAMKIM